MTAPDSYDICRRCYKRLTEADDVDLENGALCEECKVGGSDDSQAAHRAIHARF